MIPPIRRNSRRPAATILAVALIAAFSLAAAPAAWAQGKGNQTGRQLLLDVLNLQQDLATSVGAAGAADKAAQALNRLNTAGKEETELFDGLEGPLSELYANLEMLNQMLGTGEASSAGSADTASGGLATLSNGVTLTDADYFNDPACPFGERNDDLTVFISEQALFVAETVREEASRVCDEVIVIAGEGGNTSLACIVSDAIFIAAKETHNVLKFCDATVDSAEIEGCYERAADNFALNEHILDDLAQHDADIKQLIAEHDAMIKAVIAQHDADIKARLAGIEDQLAEIKDLLLTPPGRRPGFPLKEDIGNNKSSKNEKNSKKNK